MSESKRTMIGSVISLSGDKSRVALIQRTVKHNLVGKIILKFVNAKHKFKPRDPNNQGKGRLIKVPKYPPTSPINIAL